MNDGDRLLVLPASEAKAWANQQADAIPSAFTTRVFSLSGSTAADLAGLLRPLVSSNGYIGPSSSANALVVTDSAANLERLQALVRQLDSGQRHDYELVTLHTAQVADVLPVVEASAGSPDSGVRVLADTRGNRLLVLGPKNPANGWHDWPANWMCRHLKIRITGAWCAFSTGMPSNWPRSSVRWASGWMASRAQKPWVSRSRPGQWSRQTPARTPWCCWGTQGAGQRRADHRATGPASRAGADTCGHRRGQRRYQ